ncbi:hypothetical protein PF003_g12339 [Phytophthora fragariae]|nr:hypothetical protein PF003_g12339 [Phytophthora fragariae]
MMLMACTNAAAFTLAISSCLSTSLVRTEKCGALGATKQDILAKTAIKRRGKVG